MAEDSMDEDINVRSSEDEDDDDDDEPGQKKRKIGNSGEESVTSQTSKKGKCPSRKGKFWTLLVVL
jgi:hypothetical protein